MPDILLLDDDPLFLEWLAAALAAEGHRVTTATSGAEALRRLASYTPDIVIADIVMPQMDGFAFKAIASQRANVPVVFISVVDTHGEALLQGAAGFVRKPFAAKSLLEEIRRVVGPAATPEILVVDDDPGMLEMLDLMLTPAGFRVWKAYNGREALEALGRHAGVGLVITDVNMPVMSGVEFVRALRADPRWITLPVMVQTSDQLMARPNLWSGLHVEKTMEKTRFVSWLLALIEARIGGHEGP
jgi:CheY-like chemotaxis protein